MTSQDTELLSKVKELEQRLGAIERWNQARRIVSSGLTVIDESGLVSSTSFTFGSISLASLFTTSSTTAVDVTGMTLAFTLNRSARVLFGVNATGFQTKTGLNGSTGIIWVVRNGGIQKQLGLGGVYNPHFTDNIGSEYTAWTSILNLPSGTHTFKLQSYTNDGTATARVEEANMFYVILGT